MAYVTFDNLPLYLSAPNTTTSPVVSDNTAKVASATQVQVGYSPSISNTPLLGKRSDAQNLLTSGPPDVSLSFSTLLQKEGDNATTEFNPFDYTGEAGKGCCITLGHNTNGVVLTGCFLTNISLSVTPYAPVSVNCDFVCYDVPNKTSTILGNGGAIASLDDDDVAPIPNITGIAHGVYSKFTGDLTAGIEFEAVNYTYSAVYTPVYRIGEFAPEVHFTSATQTLQVQANQTAGFTPVSGTTASPVLHLRNSTELVSALAFNGLVFGENVSVSAGDVARASINIVQPLK